MDMDGFGLDDEMESPRIVSKMCPDPRYDTRSLSNCITDLLVRCNEFDENGFSFTFDSEPTGGGSSSEGESSISQAYQFAKDVLRSNPSSQANSRSNSNQLPEPQEFLQRPTFADLETASISMEDTANGRQPPSAVSTVNDESSFIAEVTDTALGPLPVDEISGSVHVIPGKGSVSISVRPETERARESLRSRYDAIQLVRRTLRQVARLCCQPAPSN
jgi:hypothetical protein